MDFALILQTLMEFLYDNLISPIDLYMENSGYNYLNLYIPIKFGFGEIEWFSGTLGDILVVCIGLMVSITALVLTWKFIKFLNGFLKGLFTGIKR